MRVDGHEARSSTQHSRAQVLKSVLRRREILRGLAAVPHETEIDLEGLKVTYLKAPNVDLTSRVRTFAQPGGIDMPDALLPPGEHLMRIDVKDSEGRVSTTSFLLKIAP